MAHSPVVTRGLPPISSEISHEREKAVIEIDSRLAPTNRLIVYALNDRQLAHD